MKYKFEESDFARLWTDSEVLRTYVIATIDKISNYAWWKTRYTKASSPTMQQPDGSRPFTVASRTSVASNLPDMRANYAESIQGDTAGMATYTGTIPSFSGDATHETASQRDYKQKLYAQYGSDARMLEDLTNTLVTRDKGMNSGISYMGAQLASTGKIGYTVGRGIKDSNVSEPPIPTANFLKAGEKAWSDTTAKLLDQMAKIELDWRMANGYDGAMTWHVSQNMFYNNLLKNEQVKDWVKQYRTLNDRPYVDGLLTEQLLQESHSLFPNLSPIVIEKEAQQNKTIEGVVSATQGWKDGNAVLCPAGMFGEIAYSNLAEEALFSQYGASDVTKTFAPIEGGIMTLVNTTKNNGDYKEWKSEILMNAIPTLTNFPYHVIVDTTQAND